MFILVGVKVITINNNNIYENVMVYGPQGRERRS